MKRYFGKDLKRVHHALKVAHFAEQILKMEGGNPVVVLASAYLHDIGIHLAETKYQSTSGEYQEKEGPVIAKEMLEKLDVHKEMVDEICDIIGHHHHPREEETLNFQILYEADWLVNMEEKGLPQDRKEVQSMIEKYFRTEAGRQLAERLYFPEPRGNGS
jgi:HD superfamily phosphodiesterase